MLLQLYFAEKVRDGEKFGVNCFCHEANPASEVGWLPLEKYSKRAIVGCPVEACFAGSPIDSAGFAWSRLGFGAFRLRFQQAKRGSCHNCPVRATLCQAPSLGCPVRCSGRGVANSLHVDRHGRVLADRFAKLDPESDVPATEQFGWLVTLSSHGVHSCLLL